jgi:hypothetical protein
VWQEKVKNVSLCVQNQQRKKEFYDGVGVVL